MPKGLIFWFLMLLWLLFGLVLRRSASPGQAQWVDLGGDLLIFILLFLLGWAVFGFAIQ
jgi:hypothetical protein